MEAEPLGRQQVDDVDVGPLDQRDQPVDGRAAELAGLDLGPAGDLVVDGGDLEPVPHLRQGRLVSGLPEPAQADHPDPEPDVFGTCQGRLPTRRRAAPARSGPPASGFPLKTTNPLRNRPPGTARPAAAIVDGRCSRLAARSRYNRAGATIATTIAPGNPMATDSVQPSVDPEDDDDRRRRRHAAGRRRDALACPASTTASGPCRSARAT